MRGDSEAAQKVLAKVDDHASRAEDDMDDALAAAQSGNTTCWRRVESDVARAEHLIRDVARVE